MNARIARLNGFFAVAASVTSRRETGPSRANLIGIEACLHSYARPSRDPIASAFTRIPSSWVSMWTWDSCATSSITAARSPFTARIGAPATAFSSPLPTTFTPEAADALFTESNRSCGSRISSNGFGFSRAFTFVEPGLPAVPKTIVSPFERVPS